MTTYHIAAPDRLNTQVKLPASKSISNRALIICALSEIDRHKGSVLAPDAYLPDNLSDCDDTEVILHALRNMPPTIDIHGAGTAMRFMTAYLAATPSGTHTLTGSERMKHRPIKPLVEALRCLGADIAYEGEEGFPPLRITGRTLEGGLVEIAGNMSSQFVSALLLIGPMLKKGLMLRLLGDIISRPYIDLTIWIMNEFGAQVEWSSVDTITVEPKPYARRSYIIESDWSAASYWYEMMALTNDDEAEVKLLGLMDGSRQGDSSVRYIFSLLGVKTSFAARRQGQLTTVTLRKNHHCVPRMDYDFTGAPDLAQTVIATCCAMNVPFRFTGLQTLRIKETDRIMALKTELRKLGYNVVDGDQGELLWEGDFVSDTPPDQSINTYDDHRMALSFAPLALRHTIVIRQPQVVSKSYPHFWSDMEKAGFSISTP